MIKILDITLKLVIITTLIIITLVFINYFYYRPYKADLRSNQCINILKEKSKESTMSLESGVLYWDVCNKASEYK